LVGFFRTGLHASLTHTHLPIADYDRERAGIEAAHERAIVGGGDPKLVAERVTAIVRTPRPALRYRVGRDAARGDPARTLVSGGHAPALRIGLGSTQPRFAIARMEYRRAREAVEC
jgi:hypothetical protein